MHTALVFALMTNMRKMFSNIVRTRVLAVVIENILFKKKFIFSKTMFSRYLRFKFYKNIQLFRSCFHSLFKHIDRLLLTVVNL